MKWHLDAGSLWYEPPVKIKHAKETSEVFNQCRLLETVYCRDFLYQGPSTFGRNCVAEERHFHCTKNTYGWIWQDPVLTEALKQCTQVQLVETMYAGAAHAPHRS
jgi:hypothetical protein